MVDLLSILIEEVKNTEPDCGKFHLIEQTIKLVYFVTRERSAASRTSLVTIFFLKSACVSCISLPGQRARAAFPRALGREVLRVRGREVAFRARKNRERRTTSRAHVRKINFFKKKILCLKTLN